MAELSARVDQLQQDGGQSDETKRRRDRAGGQTALKINKDTYKTTEQLPSSSTYSYPTD